MLRIILTTLLFLLSVFAQSQEYKQLGTLDDILHDKIPGYDTLATAKGDLNHDEFEDLIIIYKQEDEIEKTQGTLDPLYRPLVIYLGQDNNKLIFKTGSNNAVLSCNNGGMMGDPFCGIDIKGGQFTLSYYGGSNWRWSRNITFKYSVNDLNWFLHSDGGVSYHSSDPENMSESILTVEDFGIVPFEAFDIFEDLY